MLVENYHSIVMIENVANFLLIECIGAYFATGCGKPSTF